MEDKPLVLVVDGTLTIRRAVKAFLYRDYDVLEFEDYTAYNAYMENKSKFAAYVVLAQEIDFNKLIHGNNKFIVMHNGAQRQPTGENLVLRKPFQNIELNSIVEKASIELREMQIILAKERLDEMLPHKDGSRYAKKTKI